MYPKKTEEYTPLPFRFPERELTYNEECAKTGGRSYTGKQVYVRALDGKLVEK